MTKQVWRFPLIADGLQEVEMPKGAVILCAQVKEDRSRELSLWAEVDVDAPKEKRMFEVFPTGITMPTNNGPFHRKYIGTFQVPSIMGVLVFHVYERIS
jgi:hypothetical protein